MPQTVTCTNPNSGTTLICYNVTGAPATSGNGTSCAAGSTKYTAPLTISTAETLYVVAGTSISSDSSAVNYSYTGSASAPTVTTGTAGSLTSSSAAITGTAITSNGGASVTSAGTCVGLTANPTTNCTSDSSFAQRLWVFTPPASNSGNQLSAIYANAAGGVITIPWSADVNPSSGGWETSGSGNHSSAGYSWTNFDAAINNQLSYGANQLVVVLAAISFSKGIGHGNSFTPNYVFDATYATNNSYTQLYTCSDTIYPGAAGGTTSGTAILEGACAQGVDSTAFPITWMPVFLNRWNAAVTAAIQHMAAQSYAGRIAYIRIGTGSGGESFPWATSAMIQQTWGAVNSTTIADLKTQWLAYMLSVESNAITAAAGNFKIIQATDGGDNGGSADGATPIPYNWPDAEAAQAITAGLVGIGDEGLTGNWTGATGSQSDVQRYANFGTASGGTNTFTYPSMDSAYIFNHYPSLAIREMQTGGGGASDPSGATSPGSLTTILPYAISSLNATDLELYYADWQVAFDATNGNHSTYGGTYRGLIATDYTLSTPFSSALGGLTPRTVYHYRAYATNSVGTAYGADQAFTTSSSIVSVNSHEGGRGTTGRPKKARARARAAATSAGMAAA